MSIDNKTRKQFSQASKMFSKNKKNWYMFITGTQLINSFNLTLDYISLTVTMSCNYLFVLSVQFSCLITVTVPTSIHSVPSHLALEELIHNN